MHRRWLLTSLVVCLITAGVVGLPSGVDTVSATGDIEMADCTYPLTVTDATETTIDLEEPPTRIVVLHPSDAQQVWSVGAADRVVGMPKSPYTAYLPDRENTTDISRSDGLSVSTERVIELEPDIVIAANISEPETVSTLRRANVTVFQYPEAGSIDVIVEHTRVTGRLLDACSAADGAAGTMTDRLAAVDEATEDVDRPLVYYAMGDGWTAGRGTFQAEIVQRAGGDNLGSVANVSGWGVISEEVVLEHDPEWIVYGHTWEEPPIREGVRETHAWQADNVVAVNAHYLSQPGPRVIEAVEELVETFHPAAYEGVSPQETDQAGPDGNASTESQDGLAVLTAVVAIVVIMVLAILTARDGRERS